MTDWRIETRQPHVADNNDLECVIRILESLFEPFLLLFRVDMFLGGLSSDADPVITMRIDPSSLL